MAAAAAAPGAYPRPAAGGDDDEEYSDEGDEEYYDDEEGEEEEEEDEELSEGDLEPQERHLKYDPWRNEALRDHDISCVMVGDKAIVLGTMRGNILLLDNSGLGSMNFGHELRGHENAVNDVCLDQECEFIGSVCMGGELIIQDFESSDVFAIHVDRPLTSIALHPRYRLQDDRPFVFGGHEGKIVMSTKGRFFGNRSNTVLDEKCGKIYSIKWHGDYVAWATERDIVVCHAATKTKFFRLPRPAKAPRPELYRCTLLWETSDRLIVGWATFVRIIRVHPRSLSTLEFKGELDFSFDTDRSAVDPYRVLGVAPFEEGAAGNLLLLTTPADRDPLKEGLVSELEVRIVSRSSGASMVDPDQISRQATPLNAKNFWFIQSYAQTMADTNYFVVSQIHKIKVSRTNHDDKVDYYLHNQDFFKAWDYARTHPCQRVKIDIVGKYMLDDYFHNGQFEECARHIADVVGTSGAEAGKQWDQWILVFTNADPCPSNVLLPYVPRCSEDGTKPSVPIQPVSYELLLNRCLQHDIPLFREYIEKFKGLYDYRPICLGAKQRLSKLKLDRESRIRIDERWLSILGECIGLLHEYNGENAEALDALLELRDSDELFDFIERHRLFSKAMDLLEKLFAKNKARTLDLLMKYRDDDGHGMFFPPEAVIRKLETGQTALLWEYLMSVKHNSHGSRDFEEIVKRFSTLVTSLYIEFAPTQIMSYLKGYWQLMNLKDTFAKCRRIGLLEESVFVMAKMGFRDDGLRVIVCEMKNVSKAIEFIRDHFQNDEDLDDLFKKLVDLVLETEKTLEGRPGGERYCEHQVVNTDTWESVALRYGVEQRHLMVFNNVQSDRAPLPQPKVMVPLRMVAKLLTAVSDPSIGNSVALHLIRAMPPNTRMLSFADGLAAIAKSKTAHANFTKTLISVFERDVYDLQQRYRRTRAKAVRVDLMPVTCDQCLELVTNSDIVCFRCKHTFHPACHFGAMRDNGVIKVDAGAADAHLISDFFQDPRKVPPTRPLRCHPACVSCPQDFNEEHE